MNGSTIDVKTTDGTADCYLTKPADGEKNPGVLLIMDAIGMRARIHEMADRVAAQGYVVLAPNVFYRAGRAPQWDMPNLADENERAEFFKKLGPLMGELKADGGAKAASDGTAYLDKLAELSPGPVAVVGYCMGGWFAWTLAATHPDRVAAVGGFHTGHMVSEDDDSPHLLAPKVKAEVYWGHADQDHSMTPENIATLDKAMDAAGVKHTTEVYTGASHGYTMSDMGAYNEAATERHFKALFALLERTLSV
ncbi:MAG: dienelactone hydrolase family protein [Solirubrobacterales bacterium]|nr:dienelactone hydrolase family protein [Solirubrobacterales bacterium]